jgi:adenylyl- and sulfurtransferase ThiI
MDKDKTAREAQTGKLKSCHAVVHCAEIALMGRNRPFFERTLAKIVARRFQHLEFEDMRVERLPGRLLVGLKHPRDEKVSAETLSTVFSIAYFAPASPVQLAMAAIRAAVLEDLPSGPGTPSASAPPAPASSSLSSPPRSIGRWER